MQDHTSAYLRALGLLLGFEALLYLAVLRGWPGASVWLFLAWSVIPPAVIGRTVLWWRWQRVRVPQTTA